MSLGRPGLNYILSTKTLSRNGHQVCPSSSFSFNLLSALPWPLTPPFFQERQQQQNSQLPDKHEMNSELPDLGTVQSAGSGPPIQLSAHFAIFTISGFIWHQFHHATNHTVTRLGGPQIAPMWPLIPLTAGLKEKSEDQCLAKAKPLSQGAVDTRFLQLSRKAYSLVWLAGKVKILFLHF